MSCAEDNLSEVLAALHMDGGSSIGGSSGCLSQPPLLIVSEAVDNDEGLLDTAAAAAKAPALRQPLPSPPPSDLALAGFAYARAASRATALGVVVAPSTNGRATYRARRRVSAVTQTHGSVALTPIARCEALQCEGAALRASSGCGGGCGDGACVACSLSDLIFSEELERIDDMIACLEVPAVADIAENAATDLQPLGSSPLSVMTASVPPMRPPLCALSPSLAVPRTKGACDLVRSDEHEASPPP